MNRGPGLPSYLALLVLWLAACRPPASAPAPAQAGAATPNMVTPSESAAPLPPPARPSKLLVLGLRCEGLSEAAQIDTRAPRFSWRLESDARDVRQVAYQLRVTEVDASGQPLGPAHSTSRVLSDETQWVAIPGFTPKPRATYDWQVKSWDNHGLSSAWSERARFGTGLLGGKWPADWIGSGRSLELYATAPARHFRQHLQLDRPPARARLFVSSMGLVEPWINGRPVTADRFVSGWPDYRDRLFYAAYDVTALLRPGDNVWGMILGDGWYSGTMLPHHQFGKEARFSAFLDVTDAEGRVTTWTTGKDFRWTEDGPIRMNSIYHGETYDARRERAAWSEPSGRDGWTWKPVSVRPTKHVYQSYTARIAPPVRRIETRKPIDVRSVAPRTFIYDLGQNIVGWARLRVSAPAGREITLRFAEMLDAEGRLFTQNLRKARATARYIAKGQGIEEWEPRFTFFGFRYVELAGVEQPLDDAVSGVVVHNDLDRIGTFECSDPALNQLYSNALWSQKGNFLEVPTDCPQRDERLGWTGDARVFAPTALYNMASGNFYRQWLYSVRDSRREGPDGGFPDTAPHTGFGHGSPGWGEAGVIIPWLTWLHTGDRQILSENLPAIQHAVELMAQQAPDGIRRCPAAWGDWLAPGFEMYEAPPRNELIATAYFAHAADLAARIARALGRTELAASNQALFDRARAAFQREFVAADGRMVDDVQTSYLLALGFDLVPEAVRPRLVKHLVRSFAEKSDHLATGFLGTPLVTPVLTDIGRADLAYTVLQQKTFPGWLLSVENGATTIWERWDSWTPENGFNEHGMNSFNHYAYGSVVSWFYDTIAGLRPLPEAPGWKRFRIAPEPGGGLTSARATLDTPHGLAVSGWSVSADALQLSVRIPENTSANVIVPAPDPASITLDGAPLARHPLARAIRREGSRTAVELPSGTYAFTVRAR
jgi:alpha-L-rhamnosidase